MLIKLLMNDPKNIAEFVALKATNILNEELLYLRHFRENNRCAHCGNSIGSKERRFTCSICKMIACWPCEGIICDDDGYVLKERCQKLKLNRMCDNCGQVVGVFETCICQGGKGEYFYTVDKMIT